MSDGADAMAALLVSAARELDCQLAALVDSIERRERAPELKPVVDLMLLNLMTFQDAIDEALRDEDLPYRELWSRRGEETAVNIAKLKRIYPRVCV